MLEIEIDFEDLVGLQGQFAFSILEQSSRLVQKALAVLVAASAAAYVVAVSLQILRRANEKKGS